MIELKKLRHKVPDVGFQYTGQSTEDLELALKAFGVSAKNNKNLIIENEDGSLCINHWNCYGISLEIGDWVVLDDPNSESTIPDIFTAKAIEKYYIVESAPRTEVTKRTQKELN